MEFDQTAGADDWPQMDQTAGAAGDLTVCGQRW